MKLFARVRAKKPSAPPPAAPAPAKRSRKHGFTYGQLSAAISAACAHMAPDCSAWRTLNSFLNLVDHGHGNETVTFKDSAPASCAQFDDALDQVPEAVSAETLRTLKGARALLAQAEAQKAKEPVLHVTVAQQKAFEAALFDAIGWHAGAAAAELNRDQPSRAHLRSMLARSANTPARRKVLDAFDAFDESTVPQRTQAEWLRYQSSGHW